MSGDSLTVSLIRPGMEPAGFAAECTLVTAEAQERPLCTIDGTPLPEGAAAEPGYFSESTIHALFSGIWIPLVGAQAAAENRTIAPIAVGARSERPGTFTWCRSFFPGVDALPPVGRPLAIRIYDHADPSEAFFFNTVSHPAWWFREPRSPCPAFVSISLDESGLRWESGPEGAFRTTLRVRPRARAALPWERALARWRRSAGAAGR